MKNILLILGIAIFIQSSANSQVENMQFGFQLSPTFSWMNSNISRSLPLLFSYLLTAVSTVDSDILEISF